MSRLLSVVEGSKAVSVGGHGDPRSASRRGIENVTRPSRREPCAAPVWDPVGTALAAHAEEAGLSCLIEDPHGRVVCHALVDGFPDVAARAVVSRSSAPLHRAASQLTIAGHVSSGPLLSGVVDGWNGVVTVVPLAGAGHLWTFGSEPIAVAVAQALAFSIGGLLHHLHGEATDPGLYERLQGGGSRVAALDSWVAVLRRPDGQGMDALAVHRVLADRSGAEVTVTPTQAFVVLRGPSSSHVCHRIDVVMRQAGDLLGMSLVAAVAPATEGLTKAREDAERALASRAVPGRCTSVEEARSHETLQRVLDLVRELPAAGRDPLADLLDAGPLVVDALRAWLDAHGDIPTAAAVLGLHVNTLRYRVKRACGLVAADLGDPVARLEIHLRLLALG